MATENIRAQRQAKKAKVDNIGFDPMKHDIASLYKLAYETGMKPDIQAAINIKAKQIADKLPYRFDRIGVVLDTSASMAGPPDQKWRPISIAMGLLEVLSFCANAYYGDAPGYLRMTVPQNETSLAGKLLEVFRHEPLDTVFIITDGYENAPAGRTAEVVAHLRRIGVDTPIYQMSPVMSAESYGTRELSADIPIIPVNQKVETLSTGMAKVVTPD